MYHFDTFVCMSRYICVYVCKDIFFWQTNELVMSLEDDEKLILSNGQTLRDAGVGKNPSASCNCHIHQKKKLGLHLASALAR